MYKMPSLSHKVLRDCGNKIDDLLKETTSQPPFARKFKSQHTLTHFPHVVNFSNVLTTQVTLLLAKN